MKESIPLDRSPPVGSLLKMLKNWGSHSHEFNTLLLMSLGSLATQEAEESFWLDLQRVLGNFRTRHNAKIFELSKVDRALLVKMSEFN